MKKNTYQYLGLIILIALLSVSNAYPQTGDPPPPPPQHGDSDNQPPGGGAPIGEGLMILTTLGVAYAARKWLLSHKQALPE